MSQPPFSSPDDDFPASGAAAGSRPTQPEVPPMPPEPTFQQPAFPQPTEPAAQPAWGGQATTPPWDQPAAPQWNASTAQTSAAPWDQQAQQNAPWDRQPQQTSPFGTYAAPYAQPQYPQYGQQFGGLEPRKPLLGIIALVLALVAAIVSPLLALAMGGPAVWRLVEYQDEFGAISDLDVNDIDLSYFASVRDSVLWLEISGWIGTIAGVAAIVLGIIAIVQRKGRGLGITALVLGIVGPILWIVGAAIGGVIVGSAAS